MSSAAALARVLPTDLTPLVTKGYEPKDVDERGLWHACERIEEALLASRLLITDTALNDYVRGVTERLLGESAQDLRIYIMRNPEFNAGMWPNGMMMVHSGLLVRIRNEAQLASVLGHECGHYLRQHSLQRARDIRTKSAIAAVVGVAAGVSGSIDAINTASALSNALLLSIFQFTRAQESEADAYGLMLLGKAGYRLEAASEIWQQVIDERKASAQARKKTYRDRSRSIVSTHPPSDERMQDLKDTAASMQRRGVESVDDGRVAWQAVIAPHRAMLLEEQVKLNDPGASLYLINALAADGWDGVLRYYEGEVYRLRGESGDTQRAAESYAAALEFPDAPAEAYRAHGYAQMKAGNVGEGRRALARYLELKPDAADAAMVRFSLGES
ncbi:MAG TPA: M48 family metalloprotease [Steroidobacteraceae bacterium]